MLPRHHQSWLKVLCALLLLAVYPVYGAPDPTKTTLEDERSNERFDSGETNEVINDTGVGAPEKSENPVLDKIWSLPPIYRNYDRPFLQNWTFGSYNFSTD